MRKNKQNKTLCKKNAGKTKKSLWKNIAKQEKFQKKQQLCKRNKNKTIWKEKKQSHMQKNTKQNFLQERTKTNKTTFEKKQT